MKPRLLSVALATLGLAATSPAPAAGNVLIYDGDYSDVATSLAARQTAAGNTPTVISWSGGSLAALPASLSGYTQVWDVNGHLALSTSQETAYLSYIQGGGSLFLMGENTSYGAARNASLISFIATAGGGTLSIVGNGGAAETVSSALQNPTPLTTVSYAASGSFSSPGTGICLTSNSSGTCSAIAFNVGTLSNARNGSLVSVLDINFLESSRIASFQGFIDNLIAYMAAQAAAGEAAASGGAGNFVTLSNSTSRGAARVLDERTSASIIDADMALAIGRLSSLPADQKVVALQRQAPQTGRAAIVASNQAVSGSLDSVAMRLEGVREQGFIVGLDEDLMKGRLKLAAAGDNVASQLASEKTRRSNAWVKAFGAYANQNLDGDYAGYHASTGGMALGADTLLDSKLVVGGAFSYAKTDVRMSDFRNGDSTNINSYQFTAYASRDFGKFYIDGMLAYARHQFNANRDTAVSGTAAGEFEGSEYAAKATVGLPVKLSEKLTLTPVAGLEANHIYFESYTETGAGALSQRVDNDSVTRVRSMLGSKLSTELQTAGGISIKPSLDLAWRHEFENDGMDSTSTFTGGGGSFSTAGQKLARNTFALGAGVAIQKTRDFNLKIRLNSELAKGYQSFAGQIQGQWLF
ncbi:autotransporter outer membrane beta-barrel domain-containing protein [Uliginosibacterium sp. 31-16]|uniref:autotransporter family protein n=1 Tax=Uliginosibacterium sp. 31-16 TaxID=3068315 RepID=UPI00273DB894|nr:autotransporter outer membrane beta-barrel domain-containing protein [Uliginosibacterium sp. 31-16]MDP5238063.1 autotransporter outer membrane beta-barrel domain-containing protein [Uliginosibacterium sp. 31-16]